MVVIPDPVSEVNRLSASKTDSLTAFIQIFLIPSVKAFKTNKNSAECGVSPACPFS